MRFTILLLLLLLPFAAVAEEPSVSGGALWGSPTVDNGACCKSLGEVRDNIDRLDREIVRLIAERGRYVHEAARFKANPAQVEAPQRAEAVVKRAMSLAEQNGLSPTVAEATYRAMVSGFIRYEQGVFAKAAASGQTPWSQAAPAASKTCGASMPDTALSVLEVQTRIFVAPEAFRATVAFYKSLTGGRVSLHFPFPERGLELAAVSSPAASFLVISGDDKALAPFRATALTVLVNDIAAIEPKLAAGGGGATVLQPCTPVPTGFQMRLRHPDGLVVEYVQHTSAADRFRDSNL